MALYLTNCAIRLVWVIYQNTGGRQAPEHQVTLMTYERTGSGSISGLNLTVRLQRPRAIRAGQYYYVYFSDMGLRRRFQGHPFVVSWWDNSAEAVALSFLIQAQRGLSMTLATRKTIRSVILDGPYGSDLRMENYETVLLFAKGIGIAGVLPYALSLVERKTHEDGSYRRGQMTRKVDLIWILEENCQEQWISAWIEKLKDKDPERASRIIFEVADC